MIIGIGVDIVKISRIKNAVIKHSNFLEKLFNEEEIEYLKKSKLSPEHIAGRFAAKEAVSKALGTGFRGFGFKNININRNKDGKPFVVLTGKAKTNAEEYGRYKVHLSISHEMDVATAFAIMEVIDIEDSICGNNETNR